MKSISEYCDQSQLVRDEVRAVGEKYPEKTFIFIDIQDLERFDSALGVDVVKNPNEYAQQVKELLEPMILSPMEDRPEIFIKFKNIPLESSPKKIGALKARNVGNLMRLSGEISSIGPVYPKTLLRCFACNKCDEMRMVEQMSYNPAGVITQPLMCSACKNKKGNFRNVTSRDKRSEAQVICLSEKPDKLRAGQSPPSIYVYLKGDLVFERFDVMEKIFIDGQLQVVETMKKNDQQTIWYLEAHYLDREVKTLDEVPLTPEDIELIKATAQRADILDLFAGSFATTIHGHKTLKRSMILMLLGGSDKETEDGKRRSCINILALTDPGVGKTVLCEALLRTAPKAIYSTGTSSTAGGLVDIAEKDPEGKWMIKPGVLPMAHGGVAIIDEFSELHPEESNKLKEAMEQGRVSVNKAGQHITFKSEAAVFACANPKHGQFDAFTNPLAQTGIPAPILSRFDLIFTMRNVVDAEQDRELAKAITDVHRGRVKSGPLTRDYMKKHIAYAKQYITPILDDVASKTLEDYYVDLRRRGNLNGIVTITPRQHEALIRLAEAHAKLRLSNVVSLADVNIALDLLKTCMQEVAMDQQTGLPDVITIQSGGLSKSKRELIRLVEVKITEIENQTRDLVPLGELKQHFDNVSDFELEKILDELKTIGRIYEPRVGFFKTQPQ